MSADVDEALLCVAELNNESFLPKVVEAIVGMVLDNAKPKEKEVPHGEAKAKAFNGFSSCCYNTFTSPRSRNVSCR